MKNNIFRKSLTLFLVLVLLVTMIPTAFATSDPWSQDDAPSQWAQGYVREAYNQNLVPENLMGRFYQSITRAEFAALGVALFESVRDYQIPRFEGTLPEFVDTDDMNVRKMAYLDVVRGVGDGRFNPDGLLTRQEAATMLSRLAPSVGIEIPAHNATFYDNDSISSWAINHVGRMQSSGIMGGVGGNRFDPNGRYTIEQSITTILRMFEYEESLDSFLTGLCLEFIREYLGVDFTVSDIQHAVPVVGGWHNEYGRITPGIRDSHFRFVYLSEPLNLDNFPQTNIASMFPFDTPVGYVMITRAHTSGNATLGVSLGSTVINDRLWLATHEVRLNW